MADIGTAFATAMAAKDTAALRGLLAPELDFKGLTPRKFWEGHTPDEALDVFFGNWFQPENDIEALISHQPGAVGERQSVRYRLDILSPDGRHEVEQMAYFSVTDGRIGYLRILCSGYMPVAADEPRAADADAGDAEPAAAT